MLLKWLPKSLYSKNDKVPRVLSLSFHDEYCLVRTANGDAVGVLENRALRCLNALANKHPQITYEAIVSEAEWHEKVQSANIQPRKAQQITVDVDVFGPENLGENVARLLGQANFFLQQPTRQVLQRYLNPQCLGLPIVTSLGNGGNDGNGGGRADPKTSLGAQHIVDTERDDFTLSLDKIMQGTQHWYSGDVQLDERVTTMLLPYAALPPLVL